MAHRTINIIHIEDELKAQKAMENILEKFVPGSDLIGSASSINEGLSLINSNDFDLLFLDLHLPDGNGFEIIEMLPEIASKTVLTTADDSQGIKALKAGVFDYILKPFAINEIRSVVLKAQSSKNLHSIPEQSTNLIEATERIAVPDMNGVQLINLSDIIRLESDRNYTRIFLTDGTEKYVSKTLGKFSENLNDAGFVRAHKSHLVNVNCIARINKADRGSLELTDGTVIKLSPAGKKIVLTKFFHLLGDK